jgi:SpoIID/LytB domain protein
MALYGASFGAGTAAAQSSFTFSGSGWGHGVGMSQWGARGMAAAGSTYAQILGHYYTGAGVVSQTVSDDLKVLIGERTGTFTLVAGGTTTVMGIGTVGAGSRLTLTRSGSNMVISGGVSATVGGPVLIQFAGAGNLTVSPPGYSYRYGILAIGPDANGGLRAVMGGLSMQQYLYGLGEMPSSWPAEALKAQATASRTFAQKRRNGRGSADFDLYGSVLHQAYTGTKFEVPAWTNAVDQTANRVVTHNGALIDAVYSASSGGHTEHSEVVWVSPVPYLRGVPDPYDAGGGNPHASWSRTYSGAQLGSWFGLGTVTSVQVLGPLGVSGRVDRATIRLTGTGGTRDVQGASFRSTVNSRSPGSQLMSTRFTVGAGSGGGAVRMPSGAFHTAYADGRTVIIGGTAGDPDGAPLVRIVSTMGSVRATRETRAVNGSFLATWTGDPGTRNVCVTVLDTPTGQGVSLGCRDVVVK